MNQTEFEQALLELGIVLEDDQKEKLRQFYQILKEKNEVMNLTRIIEEEDVYLKHFYDSLTLVKALDLNQVKTLCDVGTGAGFPGIVLKIVFPNLEIVLLDSLQKRVRYLEEVIARLQLTGIVAIHKRGEEYHEETFDVVTSRAVASLEKLLPICMPLVKKGGMFVAMKANVEEEMQKSMPYQKKKQIQCTKKIEFLLPKEKSKRTLLVFQRKEDFDKK